MSFQPLLIALTAAAVLTAAPIAGAADESGRDKPAASQTLKSFQGVESQPLSERELRDLRAEGRHGGGRIGGIIRGGINFSCTRIYQFC